MIIVIQANGDDLDRFYDERWCTAENFEFTDKNLEKLHMALKVLGVCHEDMKCYVVEGDTFNKRYELYDENAYDDEVNMLVMPYDIDDYIKALGGFRRFNDIVDNNEQVSSVRNMFGGVWN